MPGTLARVEEHARDVARELSFVESDHIRKQLLAHFMQTVADELAGALEYRQQPRKSAA